VSRWGGEESETEWKGNGTPIKGDIEELRQLEQELKAPQPSAFQFIWGVAIKTVQGFIGVCLGGLVILAMVIVAGILWSFIP